MALSAEPCEDDGPDSFSALRRLFVVGKGAGVGAGAGAGSGTGVF
jgi:hypothetical protein